MLDSAEFFAALRLARRVVWRAFPDLRAAVHLAIAMLESGGFGNPPGANTGTSQHSRGQRGKIDPGEGALDG